MREKGGRRSLIAVFLTFAIDSLSATIVFPILAPLFLSQTDSIFKSAFPTSLKMMILGFFLASFPLAQFLFSPLLGDFADKHGRKKAFLLTIFLSIIGYFLSALGIQFTHLSILFLGRFITGLSAGNMSICLASIADLSSSEKAKSRYFSYGSILAGSAFILGPFVGGKLSDSSLNPLFSPAFPMWIGFILSIINLIFLFFTFQETLRIKERHLDPLGAVHNLQEIVKTKGIKNLYIAYFFSLFAWNIIFQFFPALMVEAFNSTNSAIGDAGALMGVLWILGTLSITWIMHTKIPLKKLLLITILLYTISCSLSLLPKEIPYFLITVGTLVFFAGAMWPIFTTAISNSVDRSIQGKTLGFCQSVQSLSMMLAPLLGGFFIQAHSTIPFIISAVSALIAGSFLIKTELCSHIK